MPDNGSNFRGPRMTELVTKYQFEFIGSASRSVRSNNQTKRSNKTIVEEIRKSLLWEKNGSRTSMISFGPTARPGENLPGSHISLWSTDWIPTPVEVRMPTLWVAKADVFKTIKTCWITSYSLTSEKQSVYEIRSMPLEDRKTLQQPRHI